MSASKLAPWKLGCVRRMKCWLTLLQIARPPRAAVAVSRQVAGGRTHVIVLNFVEQGPVTYFQQAGRRLTVPARALERVSNRIPLCLAFNALHQRLQSGSCGLGLARFEAGPGGLRQSCTAPPQGAFAIQSVQAFLAVPDHQIALYKLFQFPQISRPGVALADLDRRSGKDS